MNPTALLQRLRFHKIRKLRISQTAPRVNPSGEKNTLSLGMDMPVVTVHHAQSQSQPIKKYTPLLSVYFIAPQHIGGWLIATRMFRMYNIVVW